MTVHKTCAALVLALNMSALAAPTNIVAEALASYDNVQTVSCEIRRSIESTRTGESITFLSRVYFQKPDLLHVDNISPQRRIIADGTNFFSYIAGARKGFSRPIPQLDADHIISLRKLPGTAMDHLLRLKTAEPTDIAPVPGFPVRQSFKTDKFIAVVSEDPTGRVARIEIFRDAEMKVMTSRTDYSAFVEPLPGVWFPTRHKTAMTVDGAASTETVRVDSLSVNEPIAKSLFVAAPFFKGIEFVDNYKALMEE